MLSQRRRNYSRAKHSSPVLTEPGFHLPLVVRQIELISLQLKPPRDKKTTAGMLYARKHAYSLPLERGLNKSRLETKPRDLKYRKYIASQLDRFFIELSNFERNVTIYSVVFFFFFFFLLLSKCHIPASLWFHEKRGLCMKSAILISCCAEM